MRSMKLCAVLLGLALAAFVGGSAAGKSRNAGKNKPNTFIQKSNSHDWDGPGWNHEDGDDDDDDDEDGDHEDQGARGIGRSNDFALFDGSNPLNQPDAGALCGARKGHPFTFNLAVANYGSTGFVRVTYADGDWIQFPIEAGGSFSMSQAAGSRSGNDAAVRVSNGGSGAQLAGTLSAQRGRCASCDADGGIGDAGCDAFVPN